MYIRLFGRARFLRGKNTRQMLAANAGNLWSKLLAFPRLKKEYIRIKEINLTYTVLIS